MVGLLHPLLVVLGSKPAPPKLRLYHGSSLISRLKAWSATWLSTAHSLPLTLVSSVTRPSGWSTSLAPVFPAEDMKAHGHAMDDIILTHLLEGCRPNSPSTEWNTRDLSSRVETTAFWRSGRLFCGSAIFVFSPFKIKRGLERIRRSLVTLLILSSMKTSVHLGSWEYVSSLVAIHDANASAVSPLFEVWVGSERTGRIGCRWNQKRLAQMSWPT